MAELRANATTPLDGKSAPPNWPMPTDFDDDAEQPKGCIELHGLSYLAYCKAWGPQFVEPEEDGDG